MIDTGKSTYYCGSAGNAGHSGSGGSRVPGVKVSSSSATFAGQPSTCVTVNGTAKGGSTA